MRRPPRHVLPLLLLLVVPLLGGPAAAHHRVFVDTVGGPFEDDATWLAGVGVTEGCDADGTRFCPTAQLTRGQLAALLVRALDLPAVSDDPFLDDEGGPFDDAAATLAAYGITTGCADDAFCPARPITRAELAVLLVRALELPAADAGAGFADVEGRWFADAVATLVASGITEGCTIGGAPAFCPDDRVTRGQVAAFLRRGLGDRLQPDHDPEPVSAPRYDITVGSSGSTDYELGPVGSRSSHGNRIYCTVSHYSYDDPVVLPGQPGRAHLHMFVGNTTTDAASTPDGLLAAGNSSCEGGTNYRSSLWMPALHRADGQVVLPEATFIYYKTFLPARLEANYDLLQVVPQGLEFLATADTPNEFNALRHGPHDDGREFGVSIIFPSCVATDDGTRTGDPILSYRDMPGAAADVVNSNMSYPGGPDENEVACPTTHPYRFPTPTLNVFWDAAEVGDDPYLSSDAMAGAQPMSTLHGDYVFGVDDTINAQILRCVVESRSCGFEGNRGQLPDRFLSPDGDALYGNSVQLLDGVDRTPFGVLPSMVGHHHG